MTKKGVRQRTPFPTFEPGNAMILRLSTAVAVLLALGAPARAGDAPDPALALKGKALYAHDCSHCHGFNMVNPGTVTYDLRSFPHDQKSRFVNSVITGKGGIMPQWGDKLSLEDIDALWAYVLTGGHI
jgi:mono/diheme cytochrome c family protein